MRTISVRKLCDYITGPDAPDAVRDDTSNSLALIIAAFAFLMGICLAGCDGKSLATAPERVAASSPAVAGSACPVNILTWTVDKDMSGAHITLGINQPAARFHIREEQQDYKDVSTEPTKTYTFTGHFERSYMAWALVNGCWSEPFEFYIGPENVDASSSTSDSGEDWGPEYCSPRDFLFTPGAFVSFELLQARTALRVRYGDPNHAQGYQVGQQEILAVGGLGTTEDIPDSRTENATEFSLSAPITAITLTSVSGSIYWACVSGR